MDQSKDQLQKNMYQVPSSQSGEGFDTPSEVVDTEMTQEQIDQRFFTIAREEVSIAFNQMTAELEMAADGYATERPQPIEVFSPDPIVVELLQIGNGVIEGRAEHHERLMAPGFLGRVFGRKTQ